MQINQKENKVPHSNIQSNMNKKIRVHSGTGVVTKMQNDFGIIDDKIYFHKNVCAKGIIPRIGDRVLVEVYPKNFKWTATRIQFLSPVTSNMIPQKSNPLMMGGGGNIQQKSSDFYMHRNRSPSGEKDDDDDDTDRERHRDREPQRDPKERDHTPEKREQRASLPKRRKKRVVPQTPKPTIVKTKVRSDAWLHFTRIISDECESAKCKICGKTIKTSNYNTSNLKSHLLRIHQIEISNVNKKKKASGRSIDPLALTSEGHVADELPNLPKKYGDLVLWRPWTT